MKKILLSSIILFFCLNAKAQLTQSININQVLYGNVFDNNYLRMSSTKDFHVSLPEINYRIEKEKHSLTASLISYTRILNHGYDFEQSESLKYNLLGFGLNYGYKFINKKQISVRVISGLSYGRYTNTVIRKIFELEQRSEGDNEWALGVQAGLNASINIGKGLFINSNARYTINPFANFEQNRQTFLFEFGLGYQFKNRK